MKYANSLKYINSFDGASTPSELSNKRIRELCEALGRINVGARFISVAGNSAGHASAVMLESVIGKAGYRVGRITSDAGFDSRATVFINGEIAAIEDYNKCVAEIKRVVLGTSDTRYLREEVVLALALLLCRLNGCEFIILEGLTDKDISMDAVCAPYDLVIVPTEYSSEYSAGIKASCECIKRGVREVVCGNQKSAVYSEISSGCMMVGARLNVTAKPAFCVSEVTARRAVFSYADREGYVIKSPSLILRDCAMLVIESALALRRDGVKMPWGSISEGLESANNTGCFDIVSLSPAIIMDSAKSREEIESVISTFEQTVAGLNEITVCTYAQSIEQLSEQLAAFEDRNIKSLIVCGVEREKVTKYCKCCCEIFTCQTPQEAAKQVHNASKLSETVFCVGSVAFGREVKAEFIKLMGL